MVSKLNHILVNGTNYEDVDLDAEKKPRFHLLFLKNDESRNVRGLDAVELDFEMIKEHLKSGDSVFISYKDRSQLPLEQINKKTKKSEYYSHI